MKRNLILKGAGAIAALALLHLAFGWLWKSPFVFGDAPGVYWLLIVFDYTALPLAGLVVLGFIVALAAWIRQVVRRRPGARRAGLAALLLLAGSIGLLLAAFPAVVSPTTPLDRAEVGGRVYYLAAHAALVDVNYGLYRCDRLGFWCRQVYRSPDFRPGAPPPSLRYEPASSLLLIRPGAGEVIHAWPVSEE